MREHLIAMTATGHILRYHFQAQLQFGSFQDNLDKAVSLQMHPGQDHSGLVAQLGMGHGFPVIGQCAAVSLSSPQTPHTFHSMICHGAGGLWGGTVSFQRHLYAHLHLSSL